MLLPFRCNFVGFFYELELELGLGLGLGLRLRLGAYEYSDELDEHSYSRRRQREREIERKSLSFVVWRGEARGGDLEFFMTTAEYRDDDVSKRFGMILSGLESNDIPCRCGKNLL